MKVYIKWIVYQPSNSVKIKFSIDKKVDDNEESLTKLFNNNLRRIYEVSPTAHNNPDLIYLETNNGRRI